jgi:hypothetical protein
MPIMTDEPTIEDLRRECDELMRAIEEDGDRCGRDHLPNGRWPMVHRIVDRIREMERGGLG